MTSNRRSISLILLEKLKCISIFSYNPLFFYWLILDFYTECILIFLGRGKDYWQDERISEELPACHQMFNIFHPFDPVAYRFP